MSSRASWVLVVIACASAGCGIGSISIVSPANNLVTAKNTLTAQVAIRGGTCPSTFHATLDGVDVTQQFSSSPNSPQAQLFVSPGDHLLKVRAQAGSPCRTVTDRANFAYLGSGSIYVTDGADTAHPGNDRIVRVADLSGAGWTTFGSTGAGPRQYSGPRAIFVLGRPSIEELFVVDQTNDRLTRAVMNGSAFDAFGTSGSGPNQFLEPLGLAVNNTLQLHVTDAVRNRVVRINDMTGAAWTELGTPGNGVKQFSQPVGIAVDRAGKLFVVDSGNHRIVRVNDMSGAGWTTFGSQGTGPGQFVEPAWLALDAQGRIYVTDSENCRIARFDDMTGANWVTFGSQGTGAGQFQCQSGQIGGLFVDTAGRLLVADTGNARIVRIDDMDGSGWATLGTYGSGTGQFVMPSNIYVKVPVLLVAP